MEHLKKITMVVNLNNSITFDELTEPMDQFFEFVNEDYQVNDYIVKKVQLDSNNLHLASKFNIEQSTLEKLVNEADESALIEVDLKVESEAGSDSNMSENYLTSCFNGVDDFALTKLMYISVADSSSLKKTNGLRYML